MTNSLTTNTTKWLDLPLLESAQAQKHIILNEALSRLDATVQMTVERSDLSSPPVTPTEGSRYIVYGTTATGGWAGNEGNIAVFLNGGWLFFSPQDGWKAFDKRNFSNLVYNGSSWISNAVAIANNGAATQLGIVSENVRITQGRSASPVMVIPEKSLLMGVTLRVTENILGATSFNVGITNNAQLFGNSISSTAGTTTSGISASPVYSSNSRIIFTPTSPSESFTGGGGRVSLSVHYMSLTIPSANSAV